MRDTALAGQFYGSFYQGSNLSAEEVKNDPRYSEFPEEDKRGLALAREIVTTIEPEDSGSVLGTDMAAYGTVRILILRGICRILQGDRLCHPPLGQKNQQVPTGEGAPF